MEQEKKDVVEKQDNIPARVSGKDGMPLGFEDMDMQQDVQMPRIAILQGLSKMVSEGKAPAGKIVNALSKEVFGNEFTFIPLFLFKTRAKFQLGKGLVCLSRNALTCSFCADDTHLAEESCLDCLDSKWPEKEVANVTGALGPTCSMVYNYPVLNCANLKQFPASISLMRTATKGAKTLNSLLRYTGEDFFSSKCRMITSLAHGDKGEYYVPTFEIVGRTSDEEYAIAMKWFNILRGKTIEVDLEDEVSTGSEA